MVEGSMSIIIAATFDNRVLIASDTFCAERPGAVAKIWPLPHLPAVIAGRGSGRFLADVATSAGMSGLDFDALVEALPEMIRRVVNEAAVHLAALPELVRPYEIFIGGWSPAAERPAVHTFVGRFDEPEITH